MHYVEARTSRSNSLSQGIFFYVYLTEGGGGGKVSS